MNDPRYKAAIDRLYIEPEAITDDDIALMATVDDVLANKAAVSRADALRQSAEARHRAAMGQPPVKANVSETLAETVSVAVITALAIPRHRIKSLEHRNNELETLIRGLETRVLELEADRAAADKAVTHADD